MEGILGEKFIQIFVGAGPREGGGGTLLALDEAGQVWEYDRASGTAKYSWVKLNMTRRAER